MTRYAGNSDDLVVFLALSQELNQYGYSATVDIGVFVDFQQDFLGALVTGVFVGVIHKGLGKRGNIAPNVEEGDISVMLKRDLVGVQQHVFACFNSVYGLGI
jgi:hypothetical protein